MVYTYISEDIDERLRFWVANTEFMRMTNTTTDELRLLPYGGNLFAGGNLDVTGNIGVSGTVDGIDIAARDAVLTSTTTTAGAALPKAGGTMTGDLTLSGGHDIHLLKTHANDAVDMVYGQFTFGDTHSAQYVNHARIESGGTYANQSDLRFHTSSNNSSPERMRIMNTGNVGIGTSMLQVQGFMFTLQETPEASLKGMVHSTATRGWTQIGHSALRLLWRYWSRLIYNFAERFWFCS